MTTVLGSLRSDGEAGRSRRHGLGSATGLVAGGAVLGGGVGGLLPLWGPTAVLVLVAAAVSLGLAIVASERFGMSCLLVLLVGLFGFSRAFAVLGRTPIFLPEVLMLLAALSTRRVWWPMTRSTRSFAVIAAFLFALNLHSVLTGIGNSYPGAVKGFALGFWPAAAVVISGLLSRRPHLYSKVPRLVMVVTPGLLLTISLHIGIVASAYGLSLAVVAAYAANPRTETRAPLAVSAIVGIAVLTAIGDKRGPLLALLVAVVLVRLASKPQLKWRGSWAAVLAISLLLALASSMLGGRAGSVPGLSGIVERVQGSSDLGTDAGRNVDIRFEMWKYSLRTVMEESPLLGVGAGRPLFFSYRDNDLSQQDTGPHNSFIGYAYYSGFPSAILVLVCFWMAARRSWTYRKTNPSAAPLLGAVGAVFVTSFTNVVFETTYLGSIAWLILGAAISLTPTGRAVNTMRPHPSQIQ